MKYTFTVEIEVDADPQGQWPGIFTDYLTEPDYPFLGDYGPDAWGGYEGPKIVGTPVVRLVSTDYPAAVCDTCGDESNFRLDGPCGRDLSEELGQPRGTTICRGRFIPQTS